MNDVINNSLRSLVQRPVYDDIWDHNEGEIATYVAIRLIEGAETRRTTSSLLGTTPRTPVTSFESCNECTEPHEAGAASDLYVFLRNKCFQKKIWL